MVQALVSHNLIITFLGISMSEVSSIKQGSLLGAILLITGCCIGAGMLGLPVISAVAGFYPSLAVFFLSWIFMTTTALLLLEVNLWFQDDISLIGMAGHTLGKIGQVVCWCCFAFLFYALGIAYISGSGQLIVSFMNAFLPFQLPTWSGSVIISLVFGGFVYLGTYAVDIFNRVLMIGLVVTYVLLAVFGAPHVDSANLNYSNWSAAPLLVPIMIISFGFHNMIPSLKTYLGGDTRRLQLAIICGSFLPLIIYLVWEWLIMGLVPVDRGGDFTDVVDKGQMATEILKKAVGAPLVGEIAQYFAFFAIVTSFLGNSLSFVDFLSDGLKVKKTPVGKFFLCCLVIIPPLVLSILYPHVFLLALNYAGAYGAILLFGIIPALMVWSGRYNKKIDGKRLIPGGKVTLSALILFAIAVMALQLRESL